MTGVKPPRKKAADRASVKKSKSKVRRSGKKMANKAQTSESPFYFDVDEGGTISEADFNEPKINGEIFDNIWIEPLTTSENLIDEGEFYGALVRHFRSLADHEHEDLIRRIKFRIIAVMRSCRQ